MHRITQEETYKFAKRLPKNYQEQDAYLYLHKDPPIISFNPRQNAFQTKIKLSLLYDKNTLKRRPLKMISLFLWRNVNDYLELLYEKEKTKVNIDLKDYKIIGSYVSNEEHIQTEQGQGEVFIGYFLSNSKGQLLEIIFSETKFFAYLDNKPVDIDISKQDLDNLYTDYKQEKSLIELALDEELKNYQQIENETKDEIIKQELLSLFEQGNFVEIKRAFKAFQIELENNDPQTLYKSIINFRRYN